MKRRIGKGIAGACVAGLVLGAPGAALASDATGAESNTGNGSESSMPELVEWESSDNMVVCLYGPPEMLENRNGNDQPASENGEADDSGETGLLEDQPMQCLYGPPPSFIVLRANPMKAEAVKASTTAKKLARKARTIKRVIVVRKAKGKVTFARLAKGSSTQLAVNRKTGVVKVRKGTKSGIYSMRVKVMAAGTKKYAPASKVVTVKVRVK